MAPPSNGEVSGDAKRREVKARLFNALVPLDRGFTSSMRRTFREWQRAGSVAIQRVRRTGLCVNRDGHVQNHQPRRDQAPIGPDFFPPK